VVVEVLGLPRSVLDDLGERPVGADSVNRTCSSALEVHYEVVDLDVTSNFVVEVGG